MTGPTEKPAAGPEPVVAVHFGKTGELILCAVLTEPNMNLPLIGQSLFTSPNEIKDDASFFRVTVICRHARFPQC